MKCWNLESGKLVYKKNFKQRPNKILWIENGKFFALFFDHLVEIFATENCANFFSLQVQKSKISAAESQKREIFLGLDDGNLKKIQINSKTVIALKAAPPAPSAPHEVRIKSIQIFDDFLFTADSSGIIKVWKRNSGEENSGENQKEKNSAENQKEKNSREKNSKENLKEENLEEIMEEVAKINADVRITCMTVRKIGKKKGKKSPKKRKIPKIEDEKISKTEDEKNFSTKKKKI